MNAGGRFGIWVGGCGKAVENTNTHRSKELKSKNTMLYQQQRNTHKTQTQQNESINKIAGTKGGIGQGNKICLAIFVDSRQ
jgi:hypothetical protein